MRTLIGAVVSVILLLATLASSGVERSRAYIECGTGYCLVYDGSGNYVTGAGSANPPVRTAFGTTGHFLPEGAHFFRTDLGYAITHTAGVWSTAPRSVTGGAAVFAAGISAPDGGANSEAWGSGADNGSFTNSLAVGKNAVNAGGGDSTAIGYDARTFGTDAVAIGTNSRASATYTVALGDNAVAQRTEQIIIGQNSVGGVDGIGGICIGYTCQWNAAGIGEAIGASIVNTGYYSTLIGDGTLNASNACVAIRAGRVTENSCTETNQFVSGGPLYPMSNVYFGKGVQDTSPTAYVISGSRHASADSAGADLGLTGGEGRGTGAGGAVVIYNAPAGGAGSTLNTRVERMRVDTHIKFAAVTFANLGTPTNGSLAYCSDCTVANPCAGSGTGALAKRLNGAWVCN